VEQLLRDRFDARLNASDTKRTPAELASALNESDAVVTTLGDPLSADVIDAAARNGPIRTKLIAHFGVGYDNIDVAAARAAGIAVTNTPGVLTEDSADLAMLLLLATARRASEGERELRAGAWTGWRPTHLLGTRLSGKVLGIVGFGRIGQAVALRARIGFGMRVMAWSRSLDAAVASQHQVEYAGTLESLLRASDFVSLHVSGNPSTRHLIGAAQLALMPPHAHLVNTARGTVVDETALIDALKTRRIAGAGLDVFEREPGVPPELLALPNVCALPHLASATVESRTAMGMLVLENLDAHFGGRPLPHNVAAPRTHS
jgi:lactate dehydrogenase-like 2-hydroxyacid dehydrogenase